MQSFCKLGVLQEVISLSFSIYNLKRGKCPVARCNLQEQIAFCNSTLSGEVMSFPHVHMRRPRP